MDMEQDMINRLKEILDYFKLSPSKLADELSINRSRLSHILNGRNNLTLEVVQGILTKYNSINPEWLLFGSGSMIRAGAESDPRDLFQFAEINKKKRQSNTDVEIVEVPQSIDKDVKENANLSDSSEANKKVKDKDVKSSIKRITVYFNNNEFQDFISD